MTLPKGENGSRTVSHSSYIQNIQAQKAFTKTSTTLISNPTFTMVI